MSDITILRHYLALHKQLLKKLGGEEEVADNYPLKEIYPDSWAVLMDKGVGPSYLERN